MGAFVACREGAADRVRAIAPEGVDVLIDLVGEQALRDLAVVAKDPTCHISTADPTTVQQLGGVAVVRTLKGSRRSPGVAQSRLVDPQVTDRYSLNRAAEAVAMVEAGHTAGKVIIEP